MTGLTHSGQELHYSEVIKKLIEDEWYRQSSNIKRLSDNVYSYTDYNYLPSENVPLDGHYTFFIDVSNFNWRLYKSSDYGGLTYTTEVDYVGLLSAKDFTPNQVAHIENLIACKILGAYFYDRSHVNQQGENLIKSIDRNDWTSKGSLICDYRGYFWCSGPQQYDQAELEALKQLIGWEPKEYKIEVETKRSKAWKITSTHEYDRDEGRGKSKKKVKGSFETHNYQTEFKCKVNGEDMKLVHEINFAGQYVTALLKLDGSTVAIDSSSKGFKKFIQELPVALANYAN